MTCFVKKFRNKSPTKRNWYWKSMENSNILAKRHILPSLFSTAVYTFPLFFSYQAKIGFQKLFRTYFRIIISFLEAGIHRFFMLQLSLYTLYYDQMHLWPIGPCFVVISFLREKMGAINCLMLLQAWPWNNPKSQIFSPHSKAGLFKMFYSSIT